jgi:hypothetical protein
MGRFGAGCLPGRSMAIYPQNFDPLCAERALLASLCQLSTDDPVRAEIDSLLAEYSWRSIDHGIIYETLRGGRLGPGDIRAALAARLTRLGFPDIDFEFCFEDGGDLGAPSVDDALAWLRAVSTEARSVADPANPTSTTFTPPR